MYAVNKNIWEGRLRERKIQNVYSTSIWEGRLRERVNKVSYKEADNITNDVYNEIISYIDSK